MKILGSIGRALVRLSERPATSVPPKSKASRLLDDMDLGLFDGPADQTGYMDMPAFLPPTDPALLDDIAHGGSAVRRISIDARGKTPEQVEAEIGSFLRDAIKAERVPPQEFYKAETDRPFNPTTGERLPRPEDLRWQHWNQMQQELVQPGWAFGRIGCHLHDGGCHQPFGLLRDQFGVFWQPFYHCGIDHNAMFAVVIHLRSGGGVGIFQDLRLACDAAEAMLRLDVDWSKVDPNDPSGWGDLKPRIESAWKFVGLHTARDFHVHDPDGGDMGPLMSVFVRDEAPPKEKMS